MNKAQYLAQRQKLYEEAQNLLTENKIEEANAKMAEIEKLDGDFENAAQAHAKMTSLKVEDKTAVNTFENKTLEAQSLTVFDTLNSSGEGDVYKNAFAKSLMGQKLEANEQTVFNKVADEFKAAAGTMTTNQHALLIPETVRDGIWQEIGEAHPIVDDLLQTNVKGNFTIIVDVENNETAKVLTEDDEAESGSFGTVEITLVGCEIARAITVSWSLKNQSIDSFLAYLKGKIAEKMGNALANLVINGLGRPKDGDTFKPQPKGIVTALKADNTRIVDFTGDLKYKNMTNARGKLKSGYANGAAYYAQSTTIWSELANIVDANGKAIFVPDPTSGGVGRVFGVPVKEEDAVPAGEILLGNVAKGYAFNQSLDMAIYTEEHVKARKTDYMGYLIADGSPITLKAFVLLRKLANVVGAEDTVKDGVYSEAELNVLTVARLKEIATELNLEFAPNIVKADLVALILANLG